MDANGSVHDVWNIADGFSAHDKSWRQPKTAIEVKPWMSKFKTQKSMEFNHLSAPYFK